MSKHKTTEAALVYRLIAEAEAHPPPDVLYIEENEVGTLAEDMSFLMADPTGCIEDDLRWAIGEGGVRIKGIPLRVRPEEPRDV